MKPALHRSIIFWSGVLVMAFIAWGWWHSMTNHSSLQLGRARGELGADGVVLGYYEAGSEWRAVNRHRVTRVHKEWTRLVNADHIEWHLHFADAPEPSWPWPKPTGVMNSHTGYRIAFNCAVFIPHWLLLLAVALSWSCLLYGRHRRIRRAAKPIPTAPPP